MTDWAKLKQEIPSEVDSVADIPEDFRYLYDKADNGKYQFKGSQTLFNSMTGAKTDKTQLQEKLNQQAAELQEYAKLGEPKTLRELADKAEEIRNAKIAENGQLAELRTQSQKTIEGIENTYKQQVGGLQGALGNVVKDNLIQSLVAAAGLTKEGQQIIPQLLPTHFKVELGDNYAAKIVVVDEKGKPRLNQKMDQMTPVEVVDELREKFPSLFMGRGKTGGGTQQTDDTTVTPTDKKPSTWTPAQKAAYQQEHGYKAYEDLCRTEAGAKAQEIADRVANAGKRNRQTA